MTISRSSPKRNLYRFDPVADLLLRRFSLSSLEAGLLTIGIGTSLYLAAALISNTVWSKPGQVGLLQDWFPWVWVLFVAPIVVGYYLWSFQAIDQVIYDLESSDVLEIDTQEAGENDQIALNAYKPKWRVFLSLCSAVTFSIFVYVTRFKLTNSWTGSHPLPILVVTLATFVVVYIGSMLVLNLITNIWILHRVLKKALEKREFNVNPLHPDKCGGLRSLSNYALKTAYLAAAIGIMVGLIEYQFITRGIGQSYWYVHPLIPLDILLSIICFFGPLVAAHRGMRRAKEELLREIAKQFQADYAYIHSSLAGDAETLKKGSEKIRELQAFYALTNEFPIWPFDLQTFRRFLLSASAPLLPVLLGFFQKLVSSAFENWKF